MTYVSKFDSLTEQLSKVVHAGIHGPHDVDQRLTVYGAATGMNESVPSDGGFMVQPDFTEWLSDRIMTEGVITSRVRTINVPRGGIDIAAIDETSRADGERLGGVRGFWGNAADGTTATKPKFRSMHLEAKRLTILTYLTDELITPAVLSVAEQCFVSEGTFTIEDSIINGDGSLRPLGVMNSAALVTATPASGHAPSSITPADLSTMMGRFWPTSHATGIWLMSLEVFNQIAEASFANGTAVVQYQGQRRFILGCELFIVEYTAALGTVGDVLLLDPSQYVLGTTSREFVSSIHVQYLMNELVLRWTIRLDGQPGWRTPVTPRNCSISASPIVCLGDR